MGLLFREHPKTQPEGGFRRSPGSNLRPLVYSSRRLIFFFANSMLRLKLHTNFTIYMCVVKFINMRIVNHDIFLENSYCYMH